MSKFTIKALTFVVALAVIAGVAGVSPAQAASLTQGQIDAILNLLTSFNADSSVIDNVRASLTGGTPTGGTTTSVGACNFTKSLTVGMTGDDVKCLQQYLNGAGFAVSASGAGSPGNESTYFGSKTKAAAAAWQTANASAVLTPVGLTTGTGYWGSSSIAYYNSIAGGGTTPPPGDGTTPPPVVVGGGLVITAGNQPAASLAPYLAARVPFTRFTLTAGSSDVTVNGVTIERTGLAVDANFSGVMLIDDTGIQIGLAKTLNSNHQATIGGTFVVKAGTSRTYTIGGNMAAAATVKAGEVASLSLVAVNTTASQTGSLPIVGAGHTINATLVIAAVAANVGTLDPNTNISKDIGTKDYTFQSIKLTNNSTTEKARLRSITWNQTGSAAANTDLINVESVVNDVVYPAVVSSDGKYYTVRYGSGVVIDKGTSIEATIRGDIESGSTRTVVFDINKAVDIDVTGELYGYGVTVTQSDDGTAATTGTQLTSGTPFFDGATVTINAGSLTVSKSNKDAAQNIVENTLGQPLGSWDVEVKGEPISVAQMVFNISGQAGAGGNATDITNAVLQDANGNIVAGPADGAAGYTITFSDTVIFPVGKATYFLRGKLSTDWANNDTIIASTTPSTQWTTVTGQISGDAITPSPSAKTAANTMTVKAPAITMSVSSLPNPQTIVGGGKIEFANYILDTTSSGDDMKFSALKLDFEKLTGVATNLTSCTLSDGDVDLTTGSNRVDPTVDDDDINFTFDSAFIVPKGTVKTLKLACQTSATTTDDSYRWGLNTIANAANSAVGVNSGTTVNTAALGMTINNSTGQTLTVTTGGSYTVVDNSTQGYAIVSPGTSVDLLQLRFAALQEDVDIRRINFQLTERLANSASNTPLSLVGQSVTLWTGGTQIGTAIFSNSGGTAGYATSSAIASGALRIPKGSFKDVTVKGTIAGIASDVGPLTASGQLLKVDYDGDANGLANGNYGSGVSGGTNISPSSADTGVTGVRIMKAYPTFAKIDLTSTERKFQNAAGRSLYKFSVKANNGNVALYKFTFNVSSTTAAAAGKAGATTSLFSLYAYTDSAYSQPDTAFSSDGLLNNGQCFNGSNNTAAGSGGKPGSANHPPVPVVEIYMEKNTAKCNTATTTYSISSDQTRYFVLRATIASADLTSTSVETIQVRLDGDAAFPVNSGTLLSKPAHADYEDVDSDTNDDFIWSPRSTSSIASIDDLDWTNGYLLLGLPVTNMAEELITQ